MLERAFAEASKLPTAEQDLLAELAAEDALDRAIEQSPDKLFRLAEEALAEFDAGLTEELDPDRTRHPDQVDGPMNYREIITIEPGKRSGKPCIRGLRMTVTDVLEYLASGMTVAEVLVDFPDLTEEDFRACLAFAVDRERKLSFAPLT